MNNRLRILFLAGSSLALAGCLTHIPPSADSQHLHIPWAEDFDAARKVAAEKSRPMLLVMVAGSMQDHC